MRRKSSEVNRRNITKCKKKLPLKGILGSYSIQMVTKYKIWPFKSEKLLHNISKILQHPDEM